ncbi:MAG: hypothetical protein H0V30_09160 [Chitinophagaceae bacterium]|jgi:hypothetical protein|nr:hypothetical protein [Chitinophagaceae bacterium]
MTHNIVETIQKNLGYPPLKKVDPNIQEVKEVAASPHIMSESFGQAAIPATLVGLFVFVHTKEGEANVRNNSQSSWIDAFFDKHSEDVVERVANYAGTDPGLTRNEMEKIAAEAVRISNEKKEDGEMKLFFVNQRNSILSYLPATLQIGDLMDNDALDDRTNKMHGPMSDHMHWLEKFFSSSGEAPPNTKTWD